MKLPLITNAKHMNGARVLLRADLNVPMGADCKIDSDEDWRLRSIIPTLKFLKQKKARVIMLSHMGRPNGAFEHSLSLAPAAKYFNQELKIKVKFIHGKWFDKNAKNDLAKLKPGEIALMENLRFSEGEDKNNSAFAAALSSMGKIFVNDAFAVSHRSAASIVGLPRLMPSYAGLLLEKEIQNLEKVRKPKRPLVVVIGGAKTETKLPLIEYFTKHADHVLIGGGIANTALHCKGYDIGDSLADRCAVEMRPIFKSKKVTLPVDVIVGNKAGKNAHSVMVGAELQKLKKGESIYDIGPATVNLYSKIIRKAKTIVWNGAMGYFENPAYSFGTYALARIVAAEAKGRAFGVVGGGETVQALDRVKMLEFVDHVSTGGGAMLDFLTHGTLPGIDALLNQKSKIKYQK